MSMEMKQLDCKGEASEKIDGDRDPASASGDEVQILPSNTKKVDKPEANTAEVASLIAAQKRGTVSNTPASGNEDSPRTRKGRKIRQPDRYAQTTPSAGKRKLEAHDHSGASSDEGDESFHESRSLASQQKRAKIPTTDMEIRLVIAEQADKIKKLRQGKSDLKKQTRSRYHQIKARNQEIKSLKDQVKEFKEAEEKLKDTTNAKINDLEIALAKTRAKLLEAERSEAPDDDEIRDKFQDLREKWSAWAKTYARESLNDIDGGLLTEVIELGDSKDTPDSLASIAQSIRTAQFGPRILLTAGIANFVYDEIFQPFRAFGKSAERSMPDDLRKLLEMLLDQCLKYDPKMANSWRVQTSQVLRLLYDRETRRSQAGQGHESVPIYQDFWLGVNGCLSGLLRDMTDKELLKCRDEFCAICKDANFLAQRLSFCKAKMEVVRTVGRHELFFSKSKTMEAHSTMLVDEDDTRLDGHEIDYVVSPLIRAWGNEKGENHSQFKVWTKAIVWISEKRSGRETSSEIANTKPELRAIRGTNIDQTQKTLVWKGCSTTQYHETEASQSQINSTPEANGSGGNKIGSDRTFKLEQNDGGSTQREYSLDQACQESCLPPTGNMHVRNALATTKSVSSHNELLLPANRLSEAHSALTSVSSHVKRRESHLGKEIGTEESQNQCTIISGEMRAGSETSLLDPERSTRRIDESDINPKGKSEPERGSCKGAPDKPAKTGENARCPLDRKTTASPYFRTILSSIHSTT